MPGRASASYHSKRLSARHESSTFVVADAGATGLSSIDLSDCPRVLFRTGGWPDTTRFPETIPVMEPDLPDWLADRGVRLIGVDLPSVDPLDSKTLDNHHALGRRGITIVEGLWLDDVPDGRYELIALPLKIIGADGSPLRAVLRSPVAASCQLASPKLTSWQLAAAGLRAGLQGKACIRA